jgi:dTDP-4-amino-4,6-dideoxygalactose transaminase
MQKLLQKQLEFVNKLGGLLMSKLALLGGKKVRTKLFEAYNTIGAEEKKAVMEVLDSGNLSQFLGAWHEDFFGGKNVRQFEKEWAQLIGANYAVSVNSNTSGLIAAVGAAGVQPGDEVIVSPYTMTASAIAPVFYGAVPVFADIDEDIFCISPEAFKRAITPRTKAIIVVHIFGQAADMDAILEIARKNNIVVIEDCAQAPTATYKGKPVGVLGDMGVFSFNYHKHIHTGEGGVITTQSEFYQEKLQLIRNHGEQVVGPKGTQDLINTMGFNFRMPEIEAAIGLQQIKKIHPLIESRIEIANQFSKRMANNPGIKPPVVRPGNKHVYYVHALKWDAKNSGITRNTFFKAISAELPSAVLRETTPIIGAGYVKPLYLQPFYQNRISKCSFSCPRYEGKVEYNKGLCPVTERMHFEELITHEFIRPSMSKSDIEDVFTAFDKVYEHLPELKKWEQEQRD